MVARAKTFLSARRQLPQRALDVAQAPGLKCRFGLPPLQRATVPRTILMGQVWKENTSGENYLVTKIYQEVLSTYAVLRKVGKEASGTLRVKVQKTAAGVTLPGYTITQEEP